MWASPDASVLFQLRSVRRDAAAAGHPRPDCLTLVIYRREFQIRCDYGRVRYWRFLYRCLGGAFRQGNSI